MIIFAGCYFTAQKSFVHRVNSTKDKEVSVLQDMGGTDPGE